jgi:hypothetical protein
MYSITLLIDQYYFWLLLQRWHIPVQVCGGACASAAYSICAAAKAAGTCRCVVPEGVAQRHDIGGQIVRQHGQFFFLSAVGSGHRYGCFAAIRVTHLGTSTQWLGIHVLHQGRMPGIFPHISLHRRAIPELRGSRERHGSLFPRAPGSSTVKLLDSVLDRFSSCLSTCSVCLHTCNWLYSYNFT